VGALKHNTRRGRRSGGCRFGLAGNWEEECLQPSSGSAWEEDGFTEDRELLSNSLFIDQKVKLLLDVEKRSFCTSAMQFVQCTILLPIIIAKKQRINLSYVSDMHLRTQTELCIAKLKKARVHHADFLFYTMPEYQAYNSITC
jgi:hypothetical protein